jgi:hypothetical protein
MKVGDLVRYTRGEHEGYTIETNTALVIEIYPAGGTISRPERPMVSVLWDEGDFVVHDYDEFEVVNESR